MGKETNVYRRLAERNPELMPKITEGVKEDLDKLNADILSNTDLDAIIKLSKKDGEFNPDVLVEIAKLMDTQYRDLLPMLSKFKNSPETGLIPAEAQRLTEVLHLGLDQSGNSTPSLGNAVDLMKMYSVMGTLSVPTQMADVLEQLISEINTAPAAQKDTMKTANMKIIEGLVSAGLLPAGMVEEALTETPGTLSQAEIDNFSTALDGLEPSLKGKFEKMVADLNTGKGPRKFGPANAIEVTPLQGSDIFGIVGGGYGALTGLLGALSLITNLINGRTDQVGSNIAHILGSMGIAAGSIGYAATRRGAGIDVVLDMLDPQRVKGDKLKKLDNFTTHAIYSNREHHTSQPYINALAGAVDDIQKRGKDSKNVRNHSSLPDLNFDRLVLNNIPESEVALREYIEQELRDEPKTATEILYMMALAFDARGLTTTQEVEHFYTI